MSTSSAAPAAGAPLAGPVPEPSLPPGASPHRLEAAKRAVAVVFAVNGLVFASWIARLPAVREILHMTPGRLGMLLLAASAGSVSALFTAGWVVHRLGPRRACLGGSLVMTAAMTVAAATPGVPVMAVALVLVGMGTALWDVAMNVEGAGVERLLDRPIMPRFHAAFSLGTVGGAAGGAAAAAVHVPVAAHLVVVCVLGFATMVLAVPRFVGPAVWGRAEDTLAPSPASGASDGASGASGTSEGASGPTDGSSGPTGGSTGGRRGSSGVLQAWREPRTVVIGLLALGMAFAEGAAGDWLAVGLVDGYGVTHAVAAGGYGLFVTAMTLARLAGPGTLARLGRVRALRSGAVLVAVGVLAIQAGEAVLGPAGLGAALVLAALGALTWGAGAALGFPVAMSAASDDPRSAAARVSVVSTIGYVAFLAGPPLLGLLGDRVGIVRAMLGVGAAVLLSLAAAGAARPVAAPVEEN